MCPQGLVQVGPWILERTSTWFGSGSWSLDTKQLSSNQRPTAALRLIPELFPFASMTNYVTKHFLGQVPIFPTCQKPSSTSFYCWNFSCTQIFQDCIIKHWVIFLFHKLYLACSFGLNTNKQSPKERDVTCRIHKNRRESKSTLDLWLWFH